MSMADRKQWIFRGNHEETSLPEFFARAGVHPGVARIMYRRGVHSEEDLFHFLHDDLTKLSDPFLMKGMEEAVARLTEAGKRGERIVVYGDYDVDGITSTSILVRYFRSLGMDVGFYIPARETEGYGLNEKAMEKLASEGYSLIVTVDCGISSAALIDRFADTVDVIVTDHHQPPEVLPQRAVAVVNPHQKDCPYPFEDLAGCGVAYSLCRALSLRLTGRDYTEDTELVALGTVADMVSLTGENRILVRAGLTRFPQTKICGLASLLRAAGVMKQDGEAHTPSADQISFALAPRLNAAGRIRHANMGVRLMLTESHAEAESLAADLCLLNSERQAIERSIFKEAVARVEALSGEQDMALVVDGNNWHPGVIGIVASRILEKYHRPVLMVSVRNGVGKGSCRSVAGFNMYEALAAQKDILLQFGGHPMAAGFTVSAENIPEFRKRLNEYTRARLTEEDCIPKLEAEECLPLSEITLDFIRGLSLLEPCGCDNPKPMFASSDVFVESAVRMGADGKHFKCVVTDGKAHTETVFWNAGEEDPAVTGETVSMVYEPEIHYWYGEKVQLIGRDVKKSESEVSAEIDRDYLVNAFLKLRAILSVGVRPVTEVETMMKSSGVLPFRKMKTALLIFEELGVISRFGRAGQEQYRYQVLAAKMDLHMSATYRKYGK